MCVKKTVKARSENEYKKREQVEEVKGQGPFSPQEERRIEKEVEDEGKKITTLIIVAQKIERNDLSPPGLTHDYY